MEEQKTVMEPRGLQEALNKALEAVKNSPLAIQVVQICINYLIAELMEVSDSLEK